MAEVHHLIFTRILLLAALAGPILSSCHQANDGRTSGESETITTSDSERIVADRFTEGGEGVPGVATPITGSNLTIASNCYSDTCPTLRFETLIRGKDGAIAFDAPSMTALGVKVISWSFSNVPAGATCQAVNNFDPMCTGSATFANATIRAKLELVFKNGGVVFGESPNVIPTQLCPPGYVVIGKNPTVGVAARFCAMKYEAKRVAAAVVSAAAGQPIDNMNTITARASCKALGGGYDLLSNAEWLAIAREIESVPRNWSGGVVGDGSLNIGNADNVAVSLAAGVSSAEACKGISGSVPENCGGGWHRNKRTHYLMNGEDVWDISGNVWEWVIPVSMAGNNGYVSQMPRLDINEINKWLPLGDYSSKVEEPRGGLGYIWNGTAGAVAKGGARTGGDMTGPFSTNGTMLLTYVTAPGDNQVGFRCRKDIP